MPAVRDTHVFVRNKTRLSTEKTLSQDDRMDLSSVSASVTWRITIHRLQLVLCHRFYMHMTMVLQDGLITTSRKGRDAVGADASGTGPFC